MLPNDSNRNNLSFIGYHANLDEVLMTPQEASNNIDCRFLNNVDRQLLYLEEWEAVKSEIQRLKRIEDSVKMIKPHKHSR